MHCPYFPSSVPIRDGDGVKLDDERHMNDKTYKYPATSCVGYSLAQFKVLVAVYGS